MGQVPWDCHVTAGGVCVCVFMCVADGLVSLEHQRIYSMNTAEKTSCSEHHGGRVMMIVSLTMKFNRSIVGDVLFTSYLVTDCDSVKHVGYIDSDIHFANKMNKLNKGSFLH